MTNENSQSPSEEALGKFKESVFNSFADVKDPRIRRKRIEHSLPNILFITLCAVLCGADNLKQVGTWAEAREEWLSSIPDLPYGIPSYGTLWMVFLLLNPKAFNEAFVQWVSSLSQILKGKILAIDGKASRGTVDKGKPNSYVNMVSVWACEEGLTLGQLKVDGKSNEITAIPELLKLIDLEGRTVTIDAMGTQTEIASAIRSAGADYIPALKGNQSKLHDEVRNFFGQAEKVDFDGVDHSVYHVVEKGHGRNEKRTTITVDQIDRLPQKSKWSGLRSIVMVISERIVNGEKFC